MKKRCLIDDCEQLAEKRGYCSKHYRRWQRHGSPHVTKRRASGTGSVYRDGQGYLRVQIGRHSEKLHRLIAEHFLGRKLLPGEIVHHKDEDRLNNHPSNLQVTSRTWHTKHHHEGIPDNPNNTVTHKWCPGCDKIKPRDEFTAGDDAFGNRSRCKQCCKEYTASRRDEIAAKRKQRNKYQAEEVPKEERLERLEAMRTCRGAELSELGWCWCCKRKKPKEEFQASTRREVSAWCNECRARKASHKSIPPSVP